MRFLGGLLVLLVLSVWARPTAFAADNLAPPDAWQSAISLGDWTLVGCTVAPGFEFRHFELASAGWEPPGLDRSA